MPMQEAQNGDGHPAVEQQRIEQGIEPRFRSRIDLEQDDGGNHILGHPDHLPHMIGQQGIEHVGVEGHEIVDGAAKHEEGGNQHEIGLEHIDDPIQDHDVPLPDPLFQQFPHIPSCHIELALGPPLPLVPGSFEGLGFFVVDDGILAPGGGDAFQQAFHGKFHVFRQAGGLPSIFLQHFRGNHHAGTPEYAGEPDGIFGQVPHMVHDPEVDGKSAADPAVVGILHIQIPLDQFFTLAEPVVHFLQEVRMDQVVRIEDGNCIILFVQGEQLPEHPFQGKSLPHFFLVEPFIHQGTGLPGHLRRMVAAVVGDYEDVVQLIGIPEHMEVLHQLADDLFFIVGGDDDGKCGFGSQDLLFFFPGQDAEQGNDKIINGEKDDQHLEGNHDDVEIRAHKTSCFLLLFKDGLFSRHFHIDCIEHPAEGIGEHDHKRPSLHIAPEHQGP